MNRKAFVGAALAPLALVPSTIFAAPAGNAEGTGDGSNLAFEFHSNFWLNLHHRLYRQAGIASYAASGHSISAHAQELLDSTNAVPAADRASWNEALLVYRNGYINRDLLFDDGMTAIKEALSRFEIDRAPSDDAIPQDIRQALARVAAAYRATLWIQDDATNAEWIGSARALVARHGPELSARLAKIWNWPWPLGSYRVDVCRYANYLGAYTTTGPIHIVVASGDPGNRGPASLEVLFHEASHAVVFPDGGTVGTAIEDGATLAGAVEPDALWHAVIFYTAGSVVAEAFARDGQAAYVPYAEANGVYGHGWQQYPAALARHWQPYVDGRGSLRPALIAAVRQLVSK